MEVVAKCGAKLNRHGVSDCLGRIVTLHIVSYILYTSSIQILWWCGLFFNVFWIFIVFRVLLYMWKNRGHCLPMCITFELIYIRFLGTLASTTRLIFIQCLITIYILYRIYICKMFYVVVLGTWSFITFELNSERKTHSTTRQNQASNLSETEISGPFNLIWWKQRMTTRLFHGLPCYSALSLPHSVASYRMADQTAWRRERKSSRESLDHLI